MPIRRQGNHSHRTEKSSDCPYTSALIRITSQRAGGAVVLEEAVRSWLSGHNLSGTASIVSAESHSYELLVSIYNTGEELDPTWKTLRHHLENSGRVPDKARKMGKITIDEVLVVLPPEEFGSIEPVEEQESEGLVAQQKREKEKTVRAMTQIQTRNQRLEDRNQELRDRIEKLLEEKRELESTKKVESTPLEVMISQIAINAEPFVDACTDYDILSALGDLEYFIESESAPSLTAYLTSKELKRVPREQLVPILELVVKHDSWEETPEGSRIQSRLRDIETNIELLKLAQERDAEDAVRALTPIAKNKTLRGAQREVRDYSAKFASARVQISHDELKSVYKSVEERRSSDGMTILVHGRRGPDPRISVYYPCVDEDHSLQTELVNTLRSALEAKKKPKFRCETVHIKGKSVCSIVGIPRGEVSQGQLPNIYQDIAGRVERDISNNQLLRKLSLKVSVVYYSAPV